MGCEDRQEEKRHMGGQRRKISKREAVIIQLVNKSWRRCGMEGSRPATPSVSPALQVGLGLSAPQLLDDRLDLGRIAEQAHSSADPAAGLEA